MTFAERAGQLAGLTGAVLGWRPDEFWRSTPAELSAVLTALAPPDAGAADGALLTRLQECFPDG